MRHGCSVALAVSIKEGIYEKLTPNMQESVFKVIAQLTTADRVSIKVHESLISAGFVLC